MREKAPIQTRVGEFSEADSRQIRSDLEDRGVDPEFARPVAHRLVSIAPDLSEPEYHAILGGVAAAYGVHREVSDTSEARATDVNELRRLMEGFTGELRKLEEGLQILSAYVVRMGARTDRPGSRGLH